MKKGIVSVGMIFLVLFVAVFLGWQNHVIKTQNISLTQELESILITNSELELRVKANRLFIKGEIDSATYFCKLLEENTGQRPGFCQEFIGMLNTLDSVKITLQSKRDELVFEKQKLRKEIDSLESRIVLKDSRITERAILLDSLKDVIYYKEVEQQKLQEELKKISNSLPFDTLSFKSTMGSDVRYTGEVKSNKANGKEQDFGGQGGITMENGKTTCAMDKDYIFGKKDTDIRACFKMMPEMGRVLTGGHMVSVMKVIGKIIKGMVLVPFMPLTAPLNIVVNGMMTNVLTNYNF